MAAIWSTQIIEDLDPQDECAVLEPAEHEIINAVHMFEGMINRVFGGGIMAWNEKDAERQN